MARPVRSLLSLLVLVALTALGLVTFPAAASAAWQPKTPPLSTPWTAQVSPSNALPDYPRPQLVRPDWQNLNGEWQFAGTGSLVTPPTGQTLAESVLVPYPVESALSGIQRHEDRMWYRRTFTVPAAWSGRRVQLNFGAVTWQATAWANGQQVGTHSGGFDAFSFDITGALRAGSNEIIVGVYSPVDSAGIPVGKQRRSGSGIFYTAASGIWRTVWLEPTTAAYVTRLDTTPDVPAGVLDLVVQGVGGGTATAQVRIGGPSSARRPARSARTCGCRCRTRGSGAPPTRSCTTCGSPSAAVTPSPATSGCARSARPSSAGCSARSSMDGSCSTSARWTRATGRTASTPRPPTRR